MRPQGPLVRWMVRDGSLWGLWLPMAAMAIFALLWPDVLRPWKGSPLVLVTAHAAVLAVTVGRFRSRAMGFLYTRGYGRDALWSSAVAATAIQAGAVWLVGALIVWTPLRSLAQEYVLGSPDFPYVASVEGAAPLVWLLWYAVALASLHFAWVRSGQPDGRGPVGWLVAGGLLLALAPAWCGPGWRWYPALAAGALVAGVLLAVSKRLHRDLEVVA